MKNDRPLKVLSADAPKVGLRQRCAEYTAGGNSPVEIELLTAPRIRDRVTAGEADTDVVVVPQPVLAQLADEGWIIPRSIVPLGSVLIGVVIRDGAREPDLSSVESFRRAVLDAECVVYNTASSGLYVAEMLEKLGLSDEIADRVAIMQTGTALMERMAKEPSNAIGFCHVTEIRLHDGQGTHLAGPLPETIGRATTYAAGAIANGPRVRDAAALIRFLTSPTGKRVFEASGVL